MTGPAVVPVGAAGAELEQLTRGLLAAPGRVMVGIAGAPGAGKSTVASALAEAVGDRCAVVPLDGYHLADRELARVGLLHRKGAPETFDAWGYAETLSRVRSRPTHTVYAPMFERDLEQPVAGAVPVLPEVALILTEGNYLLLDEPAWRAARSHLDQVWFVTTDEALRTSRLVSRHVRFGKTATQAAAWVAGVDEPNAALVARSRSRADLVLDLTCWSGHVTTVGAHGE